MVFILVTLKQTTVLIVFSARYIESENRIPYSRNANYRMFFKCEINQKLDLNELILFREKGSWLVA